MTSIRKIAANQRNSRSSSGPRTAAGRSSASRNALRHGLAAVTHRQAPPSAEVGQLAKAICGDDNDPEILALAVKIAETELVLQVIHAEQIAAIERLREPYAVPFAKKNNSLALAKARHMAAWLADREITARLPAVLEKYKDKMPPAPNKVRPAAGDDIETGTRNCSGRSMADIRETLSSSGSGRRPSDWRNAPTTITWKW